MATKAFLLITTERSKGSEAVTSLSKLKGVISVDTVTGPYDIIAVLQEENLDAMGKLLTGKISSVAGISRMITCLVIK